MMLRNGYFTFPMSMLVVDMGKGIVPHHKNYDKEHEAGLYLIQEIHLKQK
ncbi:hypothetical protein GCM10011339_43010 [Echinicola rosea]|uniref:Uncharacterized protein n=1 Tax=Echinicola rosea TaxID=1807691 RepID=A0ABQ1VAS6_9BACT|nr:hypothetical protein GCM10011339_43010 [Echinicola rosea]